MSALNEPTNPRSRRSVWGKRKIQGTTRSEKLERTAADHSSLFHRVAFRQLGNHADAEDAVQDALVSAFCHLSQFEERSSMSTWLVRIVINAARMSRRKKPKQMVLSIDEIRDEHGDAILNQLPCPEPNPEESCREMEFRELLHVQLRLLAPAFRNAAQLIYIDGCTSKEAARTLVITESALKSRGRRARIQLASNLSRSAMRAEVPVT